MYVPHDFLVNFYYPFGQVVKSNRNEICSIKLLALDAYLNPYPKQVLNNKLYQITLSKVLTDSFITTYYILRLI
jgi:hypothetical protein